MTRPPVRRWITRRQLARFARVLNLGIATFCVAFGIDEVMQGEPLAGAVLFGVAAACLADAVLR